MINSHANGVVIAAGGSGGHIFPALHIAAALEEQGINNISFIGVGRPTEDTVFKNYNYQRFVVQSSGITQAGLKSIFRFLLSAPKAFISTWNIYKQIKPRVIIATGGYSAFYPVVVGFLKGIPTIIHEAENKFGLANFVLSLIASRVTLAFEQSGAPAWAKTVYTGHPVRKSLEAVARLEKLTAPPKNILLLGGSQGAKTIDQVGQELVEFFASNKLKLKHQCRPENKEKLTDCYRGHSVDAEVQPFIHDMQAALSWSDIIISRAGAGAVSEISVVNRPAILIPYPHAQGDHQSFNAQTLVNEGSAFMVKEGPRFTEQVQAILQKLLGLEFYNQIIENNKVQTVSAANQIAKLAIELGGLKSCTETV